MNNKKKLFSSLHMIVICVVLLLGVTWAWFSERIEVPGGTISAATYGASVSVSGADANEVQVQNNADRSITVTGMTPGTVYDIKIVAEGTAPEGYCNISAAEGSVQRHTAMLRTATEYSPGTELVFTVKFPVGATDTDVVITPSWGSPNEVARASVEVTTGDVVITGGDAPAVTGTEEPEEVTGNN